MRAAMAAAQNLNLAGHLSLLPQRDQVLLVDALGGGQIAAARAVR